MPKRAYSSAEPFLYTLLADRALPLDQQSRFRFRALTQGEQLAVYDGLNWVKLNDDGTRELMPRSMAQARELVLTHLEHAYNFPTDGPLEWPADGSRKEKEDYLRMLAPLDVYELGNELRTHAEATTPVASPAGDVTAGNS
ncbi:MAG: hypothetical protein M3Z05_21095 [Gemmatimonadota bacterium]|nr:hypothetical protein [Gemmatimonadota bacterium]